MGWKHHNESEHYALTKGLSAGFAAITLRDFSRSKMTSAAPNRLFWQALSRILNVSATRRIPSHYNALEGLLDSAFIPRFISLYGQAAIAALKLAVREFGNIPAAPDRPATTKAAGIMEVLGLKMGNELNLHL
jgi:nucleoporin GLE1